MSLPEIDFTAEIASSKPLTIESDQNALSFFFSLFSGEKEKKAAIEDRKKIFGPYLKPFFSSIGFTAFTQEEIDNLSKAERLKKSYRCFLLFLAEENADRQSLFESIRYRITYLS